MIGSDVERQAAQEYVLRFAPIPYSGAADVPLGSLRSDGQQFPDGN